MGTTEHPVSQSVRSFCSCCSLAVFLSHLLDEAGITAIYGHRIVSYSGSSTLGACVPTAKKGGAEFFFFEDSRPLAPPPLSQLRPSPPGRCRCLLAESPTQTHRACCWPAAATKWTPLQCKRCQVSLGGVLEGRLRTWAAGRCKQKKKKTAAFAFPHRFIANNNKNKLRRRWRDVCVCVCVRVTYTTDM